MMMGVGLAAMAAMLMASGKGQDQTATKATKPVHATQSIQPIHGQVLYQEQMGLPPQALLSVYLLDITKQDGAAKIVAQTAVQIENQPPHSFTLPVGVDDLESEHVYVLQARISVGDVLWFTSLKPLAITHAREGYLLRLEPVGLASSPIRSSLKGHEWLAERIEGQATIDPLPSLLIEEMNGEELEAAGESSTPAFITRHNVVGTGSCNRYFSTAVLDEERNQLAFSPLGMTFMACADAIMHQESRFVEMMSRVHSYQIEKDGLLYLMDKEREIIARFSPKF